MELGRILKALGFKISEESLKRITGILYIVSSNLSIRQFSQFKIYPAYFAGNFDVEDSG